MAEKHTKYLLIFWFVISIVCIAWFILMPKDPIQSGILGLSFLRWGAMLPILIVLLLSTTGLLYYWSKQGDIPALRITQYKDLNSNQLLLYVISLIGFITISIIFINQSNTLTNQQIRGIFSRILPLVTWWGGICLSLSVVLIFTYRNQFVNRIKVLFTKISTHLYNNRYEWLTLIILILLIITLFLPIYDKVSHVPGSDYLAHAKQAERIERMKKIDTSYFLYQMYLIFCHRIIPQMNFLNIGNLVTLFTTILLGILIFLLLLDTLRPRISNKYLLLVTALGLTICLLTATPVSIFTAHNKNLYFGYLGITIYHNPTVILLKPFALLLQIFSIGFFTNPNNPNRLFPNKYQLTYILIIAGITVLGILAKPNYIIALLPALAVVWILCLLKKKPCDHSSMIFGVFMPAALLLAWQYYATYTHKSIITDEASIIFAPFLVYSREYDLLLLKFFLSILFPLTVYISYYPQAKKDLMLNFSWLVFGFGVLYTYFFAESGIRLQDANFGWSGDITNFLLFVSSLVFLLKIWRTPIDHWRSHQAMQIVPWFVFGLHIISGMLWYYTHFFFFNNPWW